MSEPLPDHYAALSLPRDATFAAIKTAYRKGALIYHPDKNPGNPASTEKFHRIQRAYDVLSNDETRASYDADLKVQALRKEVRDRAAQANRGRSWDSPRSGEVRGFQPDFHFGTAPPFYASNVTGRGSPIFEERRPGGTPRSPRDDDREGYFSPRTAPPRPPPPRDFDLYEEEYEVRKPSVSTPRKSDKGSIRIPKSTPSKAKAKEHQSSKKTRDKERNADRKAQPHAAYFEDGNNSSGDEPSPAPRRASYDHREPVIEERRRRDNVQSDDDFHEHSRKIGQQTSAMHDYIKMASGRVEIPSFGRSVSYQEGRVPVVRRSAKSKTDKEKDKSSSSKDKARDSHSDREKDKDARRASADRRSAPQPPPLQSSNSSPSNIRIPRSRTFEQDEPRGTTQPPPPSPLRRSETMPVRTKRQDSTPVQPSGLRHTETTTTNNAGRDSGYNTGSPSDDPNKRFTEFFPYESGRRVMTRTPSPISRSPYNRGSATFEDDLPRRPSTQRTDSARTGKEARVPGLARGATMPIPTREAPYGYDRERDRERRDSYHDRERERERERDYDSPRHSPIHMQSGRSPYEHRREDSYSRRLVAEDLRYASYNSSPAGSRRASADAGIASRTRGAQEHMERSRGTRMPVY